MMTVYLLNHSQDRIDYFSSYSLRYRPATGKMLYKMGVSMNNYITLLTCSPMPPASPESHHR